MFNSEEVHDPKYTTDILAAEGNSLSATGEFPSSMEPGSSVAYSQTPATVPYPKQHEFISFTYLMFRKIQFILIRNLLLSLQIFLPCKSLR